MEPSINGINFIKREEDCVLHSYQDDAKVWTIGWGSTMYRTGKPIGPNENITQEQADDLLAWEVDNKSIVVKVLTNKIGLTQNQFDALVSFTYNCGVGALQKSTLLKTVLRTPNDPFIRTCFGMWSKITDPKTGNKVLSQGLLSRRKREADLYFSRVL